ncbi:MAG: N-formylglutamate deformylase [Proteobacteria bacterium]|nr:N-formylglutamate deformylase [Pseudomonadota bacterium]
MRNSVFELTAGDSPLLISIPHLGTRLPPEVIERFNQQGKAVADTDWHLDRLYDFAVQSGASVIAAIVSRYVIDLNRPPDGASLYPEQTTTGLCPLETFHGEPIYLPGAQPDQAEITRRVATYWKPYHDALADRIQTIRKRHGFVLLWEAHSICSTLPRLFDGVLPDLNFGTFEDRSADKAIGATLCAIAACYGYSWVLNGRFKGGYITRHYGSPEKHVHAVQLEMSQRIYMDESAPFTYRPDLALGIERVLAHLLSEARNTAAEVSARINATTLGKGVQ